MPLHLQQTTVSNILTRTSGYLTDVATHSLQPYRGCTFGRSLCGTGCYVQHNPFVVRGRAWGSFLEVRVNAAESYLKTAERERKWANRHDKVFSIFLSSSTDPFVPQERKWRVTHGLLKAMNTKPPEKLILQTHSSDITSEIEQLVELQKKAELKLHLSIETDRERLPGLPPPATTIRKRLDACRLLRKAGLPVVVTVSPLLPIDAPARFFQTLSEVSEAIVIDHFIGGDGSSNGARTRKTPLFEAMRQVDPASVTLEYRDEMIEIARRIMPGRVGVGPTGFAGQYD